MGTLYCLLSQHQAANLQEFTVIIIRIVPICDDDNNYNGDNIGVLMIMF